MNTRWTAAGPAVAAAVLALCAGAAPALAEEVAVEMKPVTDEGVGDTPIGTVTATDSEQGLVLAFDLKDLLPGPHRFNIHEQPSCDPGEIDGGVRAAGGAGERWRPDDAPEVDAPTYFPVLYVQLDEDGAVPFKRSFVVPGLHVEDLRGRSLVIHSHRDNYRYEAKLSDGRGPRVACGVVADG